MEIVQWLYRYEFVVMIICGSGTNQVLCIIFYLMVPTHSIVTYTFQAGLRTLHGLGPQLRRAISGPLGSDDDELFLKEDDSQKAQVIKRQLIISFFNCNEISYSCFRQ